MQAVYKHSPEEEQLFNPLDWADILFYCTVSNSIDQGAVIKERNINTNQMNELKSTQLLEHAGGRGVSGVHTNPNKKPHWFLSESTLGPGFRKVRFQRHRIHRIRLHGRPKPTWLMRFHQKIGCVLTGPQPGHQGIPYSRVFNLSRKKKRGPVRENKEKVQ